MNRIILILLLLLPLSCYSEDKVPTLKGHVNVSIETGTIECDFILSDLPVVKDYLFLINSGMNINFIRNIENTYSYTFERAYSDTISFEAFGYYVPANKKNEKKIFKSVRFNYVGKYPVKQDTSLYSSSGDWKGNIAFNGYSVRADGSQSSWYPILYDIKKGKKYTDLKYDIEVNCVDCKTIYINGNAPAEGNNGKFKSLEPFELLLFAGKFDFKNIDNTYFLNSNSNYQDLSQISTYTNRIKHFYQKKTKIPYKYPITFIESTPTAKDDSWMSVSYPTVACIGDNTSSFGEVFNDNNLWFQTYLAHEFGHYYFGFYRPFNTAVGDIIREAFPEYMSLVVQRNLFPDSMYHKNIKKKINAIKKNEFNSLAKILTHHDYDNRNAYAYNYMPLILLAIEKEIGEKMMWKWMNLLLTTETDFTNYDFVEKTLRLAINNDKKFESISKLYLNSIDSKNNAIKKMQH